MTAKVKALLAEVGQSNMTMNMFVFSCAQFSPAEDIIEAIAEYWQALGVKVKQIRIPMPQRIRQMCKIKWDNHFTFSPSRTPIR